MKLLCLGSSSDGNCYILKDKRRCLILDCGAKWNEVMLGCYNFNRRSIDACLFTHWHRDHFDNLNSLRLSAIPVYGSPALRDYAEGKIKVNALPELKRTWINENWAVVPWNVPHTGARNETVPCYAYMIQSPSGHKMVYLTDFLHSPWTFKNQEIQTLLIACNHDDDIEEYENSEKFNHVVSGHSSLSTVNEIVRINQTDSLQNVILCHLSKDNATPNLMKRTIKKTVGENVKVFIARKGMEISL